MKTLYKWWAGLMLVAVILQIGFAGYGAFYVAGKVDGDGKTIDEDGVHGRLRHPHRLRLPRHGCSA